MKLSRYEQETIILYNQAEATAEVYTHDPRLLEKLRRLAEKYPDQIVKKDRQTFLVPKRCVSVREPYSAERRKAASELAKAAGYRPPTPKKGNGVSMAESVFEAVKQSITVREAAQMYGIEVNRSGMACCPSTMTKSQHEAERGIFLLLWLRSHRRCD